MLFDAVPIHRFQGTPEPLKHDGSFHLGAVQLAYPGVSIARVDDETHLVEHRPVEGDRDVIPLPRDQRLADEGHGSASLPSLS